MPLGNVHAKILVFLLRSYPADLTERFD